MILKCDNTNIEIVITGDGAYIGGGVINGIKTVKSSLTNITVKRLSDNREFTFDSTCGFREVKVSDYGKCKKISLFDPLDGMITDFCIIIDIRTYDRRIEFRTSVLNDDHNYSVLSAEYPKLCFTGEKINAFIPYGSGMVEQDVIEREYNISSYYPSGHTMPMQYFAFYNENGGIYASTHDGTGALKKFTVDAKGDVCNFSADFPATGMGNSANAVNLPGYMVWQELDGDWYDASNIYREFVRNNAEWIPDVDENGRYDTPEWFKNIPFWIMDWMPNGAHKDDELPTSIRPKDGTKIDPNAWVEKPIRLQKELGVPIGYHLYNWHMIPFNNDYPYFYPPQPEAYEGVRKLRENDVYVMPYINGRIWDMRDRGSEDYTFSKIAKKWALKDIDGKIISEVYESKEKNGEKVQLAGMCPSSGLWKTQISDLIDKLINDLKVPCVHIDQVTASFPKTCCDKNHNHLPGGGDWWRREYTNYLDRFQAEVGDDIALTSESNSEVLMKSIDAYLTWVWLPSNFVPAFPRVYSGLAVFFGRNSNGAKKPDTLYFKHCTAQSLVFGQQMGWVNADIVDDAQRVAFLKKMVALRTAHTRYFNAGDMLRPPVVECDIDDVDVFPGHQFYGGPYSVPHTIHHVISGGWRLWDGSDTRVFAINISDKSAHAVLRIDAAEYGDKAFDELLMGNGKVISAKREGKEIVIEVEIAAEDYIVL